jgi:indolepyruvate ferredoxin oxidoreductase
VKGYCPSFASVTGVRLRRVVPPAAAPGAETGLFDALPEPDIADTTRPFNILVAGIGGSGVVTVGALLGMAAHLEGKGCLLLDVTGLAQKNGPVTSHVRISENPGDLHATRIAAGAADLVLGCDIVVAAGADGLSKMSPERTTAIVNSDVAPTSAFASSPDLDLSSSPMQGAIAGASGESAHFVAATRLAYALLGDAIAANLFLLGYAYQLGRLPVGLGALERAIELNGRAVEMNKRAIAWGRLAAHDRMQVEEAAWPESRGSEQERVDETLEARLERRAKLLEEYQDRAYAQRYVDLVQRVSAREEAQAGGGTRLTDAVVRYYFKLLAYKDEYEVARLWTNGDFRRQLAAEFEGRPRIRLHLAPQVFFPKDPESQRARKISVGPWVLRAFGLLARLKFLRGTPFDPFGWTAHRRLERELVRDYEARIAELLAGLSRDNLDLAVQIASLPEGIRGFGDVKERHLEDVRTKQQELLAAFRLRVP